MLHSFLFLLVLIRKPTYNTMESKIIKLLESKSVTADIVSDGNYSEVVSEDKFNEIAKELIELFTIKNKIKQINHGVLSVDGKILKCTDSDGVECEYVLEIPFCIESGNFNGDVVFKHPSDTNDYDLDSSREWFNDNI